MPRTPQPREVAELKGSVKKNSQRYKNEVPKNPHGLGQAPEHMMAECRAAWFEIETYALPGVLTASDRLMMEVLANLLAEYRLNPLMFPVSKYPHLIGGLAKLGMSPADRQKIGVTKPEKKDNEFADF